MAYMTDEVNWGSIKSLRPWTGGPWASWSTSSWSAIRRGSDSVAKSGDALEQSTIGNIIVFILLLRMMIIVSFYGGDFYDDYCGYD